MEKEGLEDIPNEIPAWLNTDFDKVWVLAGEKELSRLNEGWDIEFLKRAIQAVNQSSERDVYLKLADLKYGLNVEVLSKITGLDAFTLYAINHQGYELKDDHICSSITVLHQLMALFREFGKKDLFYNWVLSENLLLDNRSPAAILEGSFEVNTNFFVEMAGIAFILSVKLD